MRGAEEEANRLLVEEESPEIPRTPIVWFLVLSKISEKEDYRTQHTHNILRGIKRENPKIAGGIPLRSKAINTTYKNILALS